ncbi:MAG: phospho-N-acetylmuramoyl-pentapeptide-transferase [Nitriliruptorales bacterium]|nr:phospho-N-acetylmuramoyl-pentapeptide-transferase [Nitriliruptorales bacterium]
MIAILISGTVAMIVALLGTPLVISYFRQRGFGQMIREEGPEHHQAKAGTPTMGGTAIVLAALAGYLLGHVGSARFSPGGLLVVGTFVGMAAVGFADDFIKLRLQRNLGLNKTTKFVGQGVIAVLFATLGPTFAGLPRNVSVAGDIFINLPTAVFIIWVFLLLSGTSNAVNLTDGLDGLAAGSAAMVFGAYTLIAFWQFRNPDAYGIDSGTALDAAILSSAVLTACLGFLWYNAPPARIFMGDTGSLALGGLLAALSILTGTQVLLVLLGGLYVLITSSVIIQVFSFRVFGRRIFRMAPLHHHFELGGWQESTIIVRFWIIAAIGIALGLGVYYAEFLERVGVSG